MKKILVVDYNVDNLHLLKGERLIIRISTLDDIIVTYSEVALANEIVALMCDIPYGAISQIDFKEGWCNIPIIVKLFNIGDYDVLLHKLDIIRSLNIKFYLSNVSNTIYTDLKFLASLNIECGIMFEDNVTMRDDDFLDLASYYYMSPVPHASIEPFAYILSHLRDESYINLEEVYFENISEISHDFQTKYLNFYKHFMELDECSKCTAFKVCDKKMKERLGDCKAVMNEIYELAEIRSELKTNKYNTEHLCQH